MSNTKKHTLLLSSVAILLGLIFIRIMNYEMKRDEHLYVAPAKLLQEYDLYKDFFYNHVPGSAWFFAGILDALDMDHLLLAARLGVFGGWLVLGLSAVAVTYALTHSVTMSIFAVLLMLTNDALLSVTGMTATNNLLPLPLAYLGLGLFLGTIQAQHGSPKMAVASGISLALAASIKASAVGFIIPVAIASFLLPRTLGVLTRLRRVTLPLAAGGLFGASPVLLVFVQNPERFLAHVGGFHMGPHITYWLSHSEGAASPAISAQEKIQLAYLVWTSGANVVLIFGILLFAVHLVQSRGGAVLRQEAVKGSFLMLLMVLICVTAVSFIPTPSFPQYFAPPLVCAALMATWLYGQLDEIQRVRVFPALVAAVLVLLTVSLPRLTQYLPRIFEPDSWTVMRVHEDGLTIADAIMGIDGKVATLAPIYPLEADLPVYLELATGQFAYRTAEYADGNLLRHYRTTSPSTIADLFEEDPPAAILVGFEPDLEAPMVRFAEDHGYRRIDGLGIVDPYGVGVLYVKPHSRRELAPVPPRR